MRVIGAVAWGTLLPSATQEHVYGVGHGAEGEGEPYVFNKMSLVCIRLMFFILPCHCVP
jgi:hypothetical protein